MKMELALQYVLLYAVPFLAAGKTNDLPYESIGGHCLNISTEYVPTDSNLCCSRCRPGSRLEMECSRERDTICKPCETGTYSDTMSYHTNCFTCTECPIYKRLTYRKMCTSNSDAECECMPGYFCISPQVKTCNQCKRYTKCPLGQGAKTPGTPERNIVCADCPSGTFSNESSSQPCRPHTQCEAMGRAVLQQGSSTTDTVCGPPPATTSDPHVTTQTTPQVSSPENPSTSPSVPPCDSSPAPATHPNRPYLLNKIAAYSIGAVAVAVLLLVLLTVTTFAIRHRKGLTKPPLEETEPTHASGSALLYNKMESQHLLMDSKADPNTSSSSSSSSDSHSQSTGASQDSIHTDQPVVSSPCVNVSFTATFNCKVNPGTGSCSIPINPLVQPQPVQTDLPLSQEEELGVSCEEENSKDALQSVQESGMTVF